MRTAIESHARETKLKRHSAAAEHPSPLKISVLTGWKVELPLARSISHLLQSVQFNVDDEKENSTALGHLLPRFAALEEKNTRTEDISFSREFQERFAKHE